MKSSLIGASSYIGSDHYIGLVSYSSGVTVNLPVKQFDEKQKAYFSGEVKNLSEGGSTATYDAVLVALDMLAKKAEEEKKGIVYVRNVWIWDGKEKISGAMEARRRWNDVKLPLSRWTARRTESGI